MAVVKSLKYETDNAGHGYYHRTHRSKKKRFVGKAKEMKSVRMKEFLRKQGKIL